MTIIEHPRAPAEHLEQAASKFLAELEHANRSPHTLRAYRADLEAFGRFHRGGLESITPDVLRRYFATFSGLTPATRARKQAALASFLGWCYRNDLISSDPMAKVERVRLQPPQPQGVDAERVERVLKGIPPGKKRDRLLFRLIYQTGMRVSEALGLYIEDLDLTTDDEHVTVVGKGGHQRTVLLDDPKLVRQLRGYLKEKGYARGPLFRAEINGDGGCLRYQSARELWVGYCRKAGVEITLHQLRHTHATELVNDDVPLETIRRRLGHRSIQTTLRYAEQSDRTTDDQIRAWRRGRQGR